MRERVMVIVDCATAGTVEGVLKGVPAGSVLVQLRDKNASREIIREAAAALQRVTSQAGARLVVNHHVLLARMLDLDGAHLPDDGTSARAARVMLGNHKLLGASTHGTARAVEQAREGADYVTVGPVWETIGPKEPKGLEVVRSAAEGLGRAAAGARLFALGGIDSPARAAECVRAGAWGVAVIRAASQAAALLAAIAQAGGPA